MLKKVLVANRGEIALRVVRACKELGISTVALYSEVDRDALHVRCADEAYEIGPAPALQSYMNKEKIIEVALRCGAEAVHPGYGFLAEDADFAEKCTDAGIVWIGPPPSAIRLMADKTQARQLAQRAGVPVIPGSVGEMKDIAQALAEADRLGYSIIVKAVVGGGGRGMRLVETPGELPNAFAEAASEAIATPSRGKVYVEKFLSRIRHIEFQVLADHYGNVIHLGERECSIQRRHQKVIEEAPSTTLTPDLRKRMGAAALAISKAARYQSAGSVEFLLDREGNFYFLEMNTRLQVEHPVTEMVTGIDIVEQQVRIASGERLKIRQQDITINGWAVECRICAEDPFNDFLPFVGRINDLYEPSGPGVRVDSGVYPGMEITPYYDPLIAKVIVWAPTREQAVLRMARALAEYKTVGVKTNIPFHLQMMSNSHFIAGRFDTSFLQKQFVMLSDAAKKDAEAAAVAAALIAHHKGPNQPEAAREGRPVIAPWRRAYHLREQAR